MYFECYLLNHAVLITGGAPVRWFVIEPTFGRKGQIILYRERSAILYGGANQNMEHRIKKTTMTKRMKTTLTAKGTTKTRRYGDNNETRWPRRTRKRPRRTENKGPRRWCRGRPNHDNKEEDDHDENESDGKGRRR